MAKTTYWTGAAGDGNWINASNWTNGVPVSTDTVVFDGRGDSAGTIRGVISGLNQGAVNLALLHIKSGFSANGGDTAIPLQISASEVIFEGSGVWFIECAGATTSVNSEIPICIVNNTTGVLNVSSNVNSASYRSRWTELVVKSGTLQIANFTDVRKIRMLAGLAVVGIDCAEVNSANAAMDIYADGGQITTDSSIANLELHSQAVIVQGSGVGVSPAIRPDINLARIFGSAQLNWRPVFNGTPQLKQFYCYGGSILAAGSTPKQIGSGAGEKSYLYPAAIVNLAGSDGVILRGTNSVIVNYGGQLMMPSNTQQTW